MKKFYLAVLLLPLFSISISCGGSNNLEKLQAKYMDACTERDFEKARILAEKATALDNSYNKNEHLQYVNDKEIYYLLADNSRENANRIMFIYNSMDIDELPDMTDVLEVATSQGNEYLATKLVQGGVTVNETVVDAAVDNEMDDLLLIMAKKDPYVLAIQSMLDYAQKNPNMKEFVNKYNEQEEKDWNEAVRKAISNTLPPRPALGTIKSDYYGELGNEYFSYNRDVERHNQTCMNLLSQAIQKKDWTAAHQLVNAIKPVLEWKNLGDWTRVVEHTQNSSVYNAFQVTTSNQPINHAKTLLNSSR